MEPQYRDKIRLEDHKEVDEYDQKYAMEKIYKAIELLANQISTIESDIESGKRENIRPQDTDETITGDVNVTVAEYFQGKIRNINNGFRLFDNQEQKKPFAEMLKLTELHLQKILEPEKFLEYSVNLISFSKQALERLISQNVDNPVDAELEKLQQSIIDLNNFKERRSLKYSPETLERIKELNKSLRYFGKNLLQE